MTASIEKGNVAAKERCAYGDIVFFGMVEPVFGGGGGGGAV